MSKNRILGSPSPRDGYSGEIQLRIDGVPKMFAKLGTTWYQNVLFTPGNGIEHTSLGLSVKVNSQSVANFGKTIRLGKKQNDTGRLELNTDGRLCFINRQGSTDTTVLDISSGGNIVTKGILDIQAATTDADLGLSMTNDGTGYNQIMFSGANPEIRMGWDGSGDTPTSDIAGSSKIHMNRGTGPGALCAITIFDNDTEQFTFGGTEDEWRVATGADLRDEEDCAIRINSSGDIGFRGVAAAAAPDYTISNLSTDRALDCDSTSTAELADVLGQLITDLIAMGILQ